MNANKESTVLNDITQSPTAQQSQLPGELAPIPDRNISDSNDMNSGMDPTMTAELQGSNATASEQSMPRQTRKVKIRRAMKDKGVFETGVEVVEHELELDENEDG